MLVSQLLFEHNYKNHNRKGKMSPSCKDKIWTKAYSSNNKKMVVVSPIYFGQRGLRFSPKCNKLKNMHDAFHLVLLWPKAINFYCLL